MSNLNRSWKRAAKAMRAKYIRRETTVKRYRVWTKNSNWSISLMTDWMTYGQAKKYILGRWGHHPPFAFISSAANAESFRRYH